MTSSYHYVWLIWAGSFLIPWAILFIVFRQYRRVMIKTSLCTALFGLTEPLFVPEYWNPPSLLDLAQTTGFDIESLIFTFGIGGTGAILYNVVTHSRFAAVGNHERTLGRHRLHRHALLVPVWVFPLLYFFPWNPIYPALIAMAAGGTAAMLCRPDLTEKTWVGGTLFMSYYALFMLALRLSAPGYIEQVWNLDALTGVVIFGVPLEELLFGLCFGLYWANVYEHLSWTAPRSSTGQRYITV